VDASVTVAASASGSKSIHPELFPPK
jgi:hypothetical protein